ncbi:hypothetical protein NDU88_001006 [Pleurodeles waltl]|uniref:Uncharacterized protein n=1 Tax=Pleurodeles waltl TaxID=8319 RepID=A0AAV7SAC3_PLEWA|nr:hypothetical protein NDU88_001006 [Pleurodeles waltl]
MLRARSGPGPIATWLPRGVRRPGGAHRRDEAFPPWRRRAWQCCWTGMEVAGGGPQGGVALAVRGSP